VKRWPSTSLGLNGFGLFPLSPGQRLAWALHCWALMGTGVDGKTQVRLVTLRTEARQLRERLDGRVAMERRRLQVPLDTQRRRLAVLEATAARLDDDVVALERGLSAVRRPRSGAAVVARAVPGPAAVAAALVLWLAGGCLAVLEPKGQEPLVFGLAAPVAFAAVLGFGSGRGGRR